MKEWVGVIIASKLFFHIMISFAFFVGIILMAAPEAFESLNRALQKEYGMRKRIIPKLEESSIDVIDKFAIRNRFLVGLVLSVVSFALLLIFK